MDDQNTKSGNSIFKVEISRNSSKVSVELHGSEEFIDEYQTKLESMISFLDNYLYELDDSEKVDNEAYDEEFIQDISEKISYSTFDKVAEIIKEVKFRYSDVDIVLLAAVFVQQISPTNTFTTVQVSNCIKNSVLENLSNPSHSLKLNFDSERIDRNEDGYFLTEKGMHRVLTSFSTIFLSM